MGSTEQAACDNLVACLQAILVPWWLHEPELGQSGVLGLIRVGVCATLRAREAGWSSSSRVKRTRLNRSSDDSFSYRNHLAGCECCRTGGRCRSTSLRTWNDRHCVVRPKFFRSDTTFLSTRLPFSHLLLRWALACPLVINWASSSVLPSCLPSLPVSPRLHVESIRTNCSILDGHS
jgi:hypothetical protein